MWNMKHNIIHHAYTNIDGVDDDIDAQPWLRMRIHSEIQVTCISISISGFVFSYLFWVLCSTIKIF